MKLTAVPLALALGLICAAASTPASRADDCARLQTAYPDSFVGRVRPDTSDSGKIDAKWLGRIAIAENYEAKYPGGPIWDGDSTANDDANDQSTVWGDDTTPEYARLGWSHPIDWAVGGDNAANVLYRLYAMEQGLDVSGKSNVPMSLKRSNVNLLEKVETPFVVLHIGTNALDTTEPVANVVADIEALTCEIHRDLPLAPKIVVVSIYPRGPFFKTAIARRDQINAAVALAASHHRYPFVFVDETGYLLNLCQGHFDRQGQCFYFKDDIHPKAPTSYRVDQTIAEALKN